MHSRLALSLIAVLLGSCGGSPDGSITPPPIPLGSLPTTGTGTLTVKVTSKDLYPLANATVRVKVQDVTYHNIATGETGGDGTVTFHSLPRQVHLSVSHEFGESLGRAAEVSQSGVTSLELALTPYRPHPAAALFPVEIPSGSVNADRSQLRLRFRLVASQATPFITVDPGWPLASPYLGISFTHDNYWERRDCHLYVSRDNVAPVCESWGAEGPYDVEAVALSHDTAGTIPMPPASGSASSTMLLLDQSRHHAQFDPHAYRSFAARNLIQRLLGEAQAGKSLSIAGMAGDDDASSPATLPQRPLWVPRGTGEVFSTDRDTLTSDVSILEPLTGGSAPVYQALDSSLTLAASQSSPGNRTLIAMVGAVGDRPATSTALQAALSDLRSKQNAAGIRVIFVAAMQDMAFESRDALAELAAALQAPVLSPGAVPGGGGYYTQTSATGSYAALDLAADLIEGKRLPTLTATVLVKADTPNAFPAGSTLRGVVFLQSNQCPWDCMEVPLEFAVPVP